MYSGLGYQAGEGIIIGMGFLSRVRPTLTFIRQETSESFREGLQRDGWLPGRRLTNACRKLSKRNCFRCSCTGSGGHFLSFSLILVLFVPNTAVGMHV